jgi:exodeoxyribonuclease V beta subunit
MSLSEFSLFNAPLTGLNMVEASAGTGKTWNITGLVVRMLAERDAEQFGPENILVVTFTKAATQELRDRIFTRIRESADVLSGKAVPGDDPFLGELLQRYGSDSVHLHRLEKALLNMDQAAVFTIHGFCQQALQEYVFESESGFSLEYTGDDEELRQEAADDVWRETMNALDPKTHSEALLLQLMTDTFKSPDHFLKRIRPLIGKPYVKVAENEPEILLSDSLRSLDSLRSRLKKLYDREEILRVLSVEGLYQSTYKPEQILRYLNAAEQLPSFDKNVVVDALKLSQSFIEKKVRNGFETPKHPFFQALDDYPESFSDKTIEDFTACLFLKFSDRLRELKEQRQIRSFDDILIDMEEAVNRNQEMRMRLREQYPAALVDEFQDTDPIQLSIFTRLYKEAREKCCLYMIGDPKQSVYSFRGADINSYLKAASMPDVQMFSLSTNYRSSDAMVWAVNALFEYGEKGEQWPGGITYLPSRANRTESRLRIDSDLAADQENIPLHFLADNDSDGLTKEQSRASVAVTTAHEIVRLLNLSAGGKAKLVTPDGEKPLQPGDIAVLVADKYTGEEVQQALFRRGVKSMRKSGSSIFISDEARLIIQLIQIVFRTVGESQIRLFLFGRVMGYRMSDLLELDQDSEKNAGLYGALDDLRLHALRYGFASMLRRFLNEKLALDNGRPVSPLSRMLIFPDGERIYTNPVMKSSESGLRPKWKMRGIRKKRKSGLKATIIWFRS